MRKVREVIVVEGRYDKNALRQAVDATVVETGGFGVFSDRERLALLRRLAAERGLILLTDSDGAGGVIRSHISSALPKDKIYNLYIPRREGKEKRKEKALTQEEFGKIFHVTRQTVSNWENEKGFTFMEKQIRAI